MEHKVFSQMENDAKQIKSISTHTCSKLLEKKDLIVETVNTQMSRRPDIHRLIGYNPLQMMYDNHRNHFNLIIQVLKLQEIDILINMIPWVYRTYHIHGFDYDYFPIAFQHWIIITKCQAPLSYLSHHSFNLSIIVILGVRS